MMHSRFKVSGDSVCYFVLVSNDKFHSFERIGLVSCCICELDCSVIPFNFQLLYLDIRFEFDNAAEKKQTKPISH